MFTCITHIELHTMLKCGGDGTTRMFETSITNQPRLKDMVTWLETGYFPIHPEYSTFRPSRIRQIDEDTLAINGILIIPHSQDSLEYYQKLITEGWKPNLDDAEKIRSLGYKHFEPEKFEV